MNLFSENTFQSFWGIPSGFGLSEEILRDQAKRLFPGVPHPQIWDALAALALGEEQFGPQHFQLKGIRHMYYTVRPFLPGWVRPLLHKMAGSRQFRDRALLQWPVEDRLVRFLLAAMRALMLDQRVNVLEHIRFWPHGKRFAFVITHDVESAAGQAFAPRLADLDEQYGFRSAFNFVPHAYPLAARLIHELKLRGFEVGVHGWKHDGRLFSSRLEFDKQARQINQVMAEWGAAGFRSPLTHRNPHWMQALEIEYDSSFFDTDPFEPIPGGTMSIWPFHMGRFVELPYTLAQDHTLMITLGEKTPRLWLEKVDFIRQYCGMALVNVHPDYQRSPAFFAIYADFLRQMRERNDFWHALPRDVARWWKKRSALDLPSGKEQLQSVLPGATTGTICLVEDSPGIEMK